MVTPCFILLPKGMAFEDGLLFEKSFNMKDLGKTS